MCRKNPQHGLAPQDRRADRRLRPLAGPNQACTVRGRVVGAERDQRAALPDHSLGGRPGCGDRSGRIPHAVIHVPAICEAVRHFIIKEDGKGIEADDRAARLAQRPFQLLNRPRCRQPGGSRGNRPHALRYVPRPLFRAAKGFFRLLSIGDILAGAYQTDGLSRRVRADRPEAAEHPHRPVWPKNPFFEIEGQPGAIRLSKLGSHTFTVIRVHPLQVSVVGWDEFFRL